MLSSASIWKRSPRNPFVQDLSKGPPPNDDLDLQLVWLAADGYEIECLEGDALRAPSPDRYLKGINANAIDCETTVADRIAMGPYAIYRRFPGFAVAVDLQGPPFIAPGVTDYGVFTLQPS